MTTLPEVFADLLLSLHSASSAFIERILSCFSLMHSELQNRLGYQRVVEMVFVRVCFMVNMNWSINANLWSADITNSEQTDFMEYYE